jgi:thiol peroxidase
MATITFQENPVQTAGDLPSVGSQAPDFTLIGPDLSEMKLADFHGKRLVLNIFPSIDTPVCANSVRRFDQDIAKLPNTEVLCVSADLPFAQSRFIGAEKLENVKGASTFRDAAFGEASGYGVMMQDSVLKGLMSRAVVVIGEDGKVLYTEQVPDIAQEPSYQPVIDALA